MTIAFRKLTKNTGMITCTKVCSVKIRKVQDSNCSYYYGYFITPSKTFKLDNSISCNQSETLASIKDHKEHLVNTGKCTIFEENKISNN